MAYCIHYSKITQIYFETLVNKFSKKNLRKQTNFTLQIYFMKSLPFIFLIFIALSACKNDKVPTNFDYGTIDDNEYSNDFFDFSLEFDETWTVQDQTEMNQIKDLGTSVIEESNKDLAEVVEASMVNTAFLFSIFKYTMGSTTQFNPSLLILAENSNNYINSFQTGKDYLVEAKKLMEQSNVGFAFEDEISLMTIDGQDFYVLKAKMLGANNEIQQEYIATLKHGFALSYILSFNNTADQIALYEMIHSSNF